MKKSVAIGAAVGALAAGAATVYINGDGGGSVAAYAAKYDGLYRQNIPVKISGACYSSCTMGLGYSNVCFTRDAVLGFHPGYYPPYLFGLLGSPAATQMMLQHYPKDALALISQRGGLNNNGGFWYPSITLIRATEFPSHVCP